MIGRRLIVDVLAGVLVAGTAFAGARSAYLATTPQSFSQAEFGPAVMVAVGRGFVNPEPAADGALARFLAMQSDAIAAADVHAVAAGEPDQFQNMHRYLLIVIGHWWRFAGISWQRLAEVAGLMHAMSAIAIFILLRMFVPLAAALAGALWLAVSPLQLLYAPHLRDFVKGPFVLAAIPAIVGLVLRASSPRSIAWYAAAAGIVIGAGIGFRMDVAIMAPIAVASVVLFRGARPWRALGEKALAVGVLVMALAISGWPVVSRLSSGGSNALHVVLLGYSDGFDSRLGLEPASYGYLPFYSDTYLNNVLRTRAAVATGADAPMPSRAYDAAGFELWRQWLRHFPADAYIRLLAATDGVLNLAFQNPTARVLALGGTFEWLNGWRGWGFVLGLLLVTAAAMAGPGRALFATLVLVALAGYPSLQFDPRHYYHLQAIPIVVIVAAASALVAKAMALVRGTAANGTKVVPPPAWWRAIATAALIVVAVTVMPVTTLRAYQANHLGGVFARFLEADRIPLDVEFVPLAANRWLARWPGVQGEASLVHGLRSAYYLAEFRSDDSAEAMAIGLHYDYASGPVSCALTRTLATSAGIARFAFPAYSMEGDSSFEGIQMGPEMRQRLVGIYRVGRGPATMPIDLRLASDWQQRRLFQRFITEERLRTDDAGVAMFGPADHCGSQLQYFDASLSRAVAIDGPHVTVGSAQATLGPRGIAFNGSADVNAPDLIRMAPVAMAAGDALVVRVHVERGGLQVGLLRDGLWYRTVLVPRPGTSVVVVPVAESGNFEPRVAGAAPGWRSALSFSLDRLAVVRADGQAVAPQEWR